MSDFKQAIKWLKEGKKVRRAKWKFGYELHFYDDGYRIAGKSLPNTDDKDFFEVRCGSFKIEDFEATDWEIFEEEKESLSDKIYKYAPGAVRCPDTIAVEDAKEKIQNAQRRIEDEDNDFKEDIIALIEINNYGKEDLIVKMRRLCKAHNEEKSKIFKEEFGEEIC